MQITIRGKLFPSSEQAQRLGKLMRLQSSCMRYAYRRLCEGKAKSGIETDLKEKFGGVNSR
jgi:predicted transposase